MATQGQRQQPQPMVSDLRTDLDKLLVPNDVSSVDQNGNVYQQDVPTDLLTSDGMGQLPLDMFEAELTAFLQGEVPADVWGNWEWQ